MRLARTPALTRPLLAPTELTRADTPATVMELSGILEMGSLGAGGMGMVRVAVWLTVPVSAADALVVALVVGVGVSFVVVLDIDGVRRVVDSDGESEVVGEGFVCVSRDLEADLEADVVDDRLRHDFDSESDGERIVALNETLSELLLVTFLRMGTIEGVRDIDDVHCS